jgi:hypothetical protein
MAGSEPRPTGSALPAAGPAAQPEAASMGVGTLVRYLTGGRRSELWLPGPRR